MSKDFRGANSATMMHVSRMLDTVMIVNEAGSSVVQYL